MMYLLFLYLFLASCITTTVIYKSDCVQTRFKIQFIKNEVVERGIDYINKWKGEKRQEWKTLEKYKNKISIEKMEK